MRNPAKFLRPLLRAILLPFVFVAAGTIILAPMLYLGQTDQATDRSVSPDMVPSASPLRHLAITALFRAGYIRMNPPLPPVEGEDPAEAGPNATDMRWVRVALPQAMCSRDDLVAGIVSAEVYMRPASRRGIEVAVAEARRSLFGRYPDWSFGMGQIKLSTARAAIEAAQARLTPVLGAEAVDFTLTDDEVFDLLQDPCANVQIVGMVVDMLRQPGDSAAEIAARYRGGVGTPTIPGVVGYEAVVAEIAETVLPALNTSPDVGLPLAWINAGSEGAGKFVYLAPLAAPEWSQLAPILCLPRSQDEEVIFYAPPPEGVEGGGASLGVDEMAGFLGLIDAPATDLVFQQTSATEATGSGFALLSGYNDSLAAVPELTERAWRKFEAIGVEGSGIGAEVTGCYGVLVLAAKTGLGPYFAALTQRMMQEGGGG